MTRRLCAVALLAAIAAPTPARAGLLPVQVSVTPDSGNYRWTYAIVLPTDSQLQSGDYFTIYDFGGMVNGTIQAPSGWTVAVANVGTTPNRVDPADDASLPNLTFTYGGATINTGQTGLGNFWADSTDSLATDSFFTASTHRTSDGKPDSNITETIVPVPTASTPPPSVPEPATMVLALLGVPLLGVTRLIRRKA
ncbi:MAG TPA: hypothetical protein VN641_18765 [Urbifossiella sp.]|nr:hypothetical protein [Urbifossiella sp.]